jgi:hypothetical protein
MDDHRPLESFSPGERQMMALALRLEEGEMILPGADAGQHRDAITLELDGWLEPGTLRPTGKLRNAPWVQKLIDDPLAFGD